MMKDAKKNVYFSYYPALEHQYAGHPESPDRLKWMADWVNHPPYTAMANLPFDPASEADVRLVHPASFLEELKAESRLGPHQFEPAPSYVTEYSYTAALEAAGATLTTSRKILSEDTGRGFAIVRPPGHHAESQTAMGFCLLNNIAIAAADAVASGISRVAILDLDAHHGNGTEAIFSGTPEVAYCSIHEGGIYPGTGSVNVPEGNRKRVINIPLPAFAGNSAFNAVIEQIVVPWLEQFRPEMLFISAGFDAHFSDPITTLTVDTQGFHQIAGRLVELAELYCEGRLLFVLEGGYDHLALRDNVQATLAAMCGESSFPDTYGTGPDVAVDIQQLMDTVRSIHALKE